MWFISCLINLENGFFFNPNNFLNTRTTWRVIMTLRNSEMWGSIMNSASQKSYFWQVLWKREGSLPGNLTTKRKRAKQWRRITKKEKRYMKYLCQTKSNSGMDGNMSPSCLTPNKRRGAEVYRVSGHAGRAWWQE